MKIEKVNFECFRDNLKIKGVIYKPCGNNLKIIIVSHGFMANMMTTKYYARHWARMGYCALAFDFNGGGIGSKSSGKTTDMSVFTEVEDLKAVINYAKSLPYTDENSVTLMGCSQGGFVSAITAAQLQDKIEKLILFYPALCIPDDARSGKMMFAKFDPDNIPQRIPCGPMTLGKRYVQDVVDLDPYQIITRYKGPVLIVHGTSDAIVNLDYAVKAQKLYENSKLVIIEKGTHMFVGRADKKAIKAVEKFL